MVRKDVYNVDYFSACSAVHLFLFDIFLVGFDVILRATSVCFINKKYVFDYSIDLKY